MNVTNNNKKSTRNRSWHIAKYWMPRDPMLVMKERHHWITNVKNTLHSYFAWVMRGTNRKIFSMRRHGVCCAWYPKFKNRLRALMDWLSTRRTRSFYLWRRRTLRQLRLQKVWWKYFLCVDIVFVTHDILKLKIDSERWWIASAQGEHAPFIGCSLFSWRRRTLRRTHRLQKVWWVAGISTGLRIALFHFKLFTQVTTQAR